MEQEFVCSQIRVRGLSAGSCSRPTPPMGAKSRRHKHFGTSHFDNGGDVPFFATTGDLVGATGGFSATACAGRYFATMAGSSEANSVSGNRNQDSSLPSSEIPQ